MTNVEKVLLLDKLYGLCDRELYFRISKEAIRLFKTLSSHEAMEVIYKQKDLFEIFAPYFVRSQKDLALPA